MTPLYILMGIVVVLLILLEAFEGLVLPRQVTRPFRFARFFYYVSWWLWSGASRMVPAGKRRETFLSIYGPLSLLVLFVLWALALVLGFALLQGALWPAPVSFFDMFYFSGTTFTTLGYGDVTPGTAATRALAVAEAATGFGYFAVVIGYLPVLYQAFSHREGLISLLDARAGSPPAAGRLLLRTLDGPHDGAILQRFLEDGERWSAELLESHLSFPVLGYYRSQHGNQSWLAALVCILDTCALMLTVAEGVDQRQARLTFAMARHVIVDLSLILRQVPEQPQCSNRLPEARLGELCELLRQRGVSLRDDAVARDKLSELRRLYEPFAVALGGFFHLAVPEFWPSEERPDNWQTSAWMRRAAPLEALGYPGDEHFD
jgi:hypothetical protein